MLLQAVQDRSGARGLGHEGEAAVPLQPLGPFATLVAGHTGFCDGRTRGVFPRFGPLDPRHVQGGEALADGHRGGVLLEGAVENLLGTGFADRGVALQGAGPGFVGPHRLLVGDGRSGGDGVAGGEDVLPEGVELLEASLDVLQLAVGVEEQATGFVAAVGPGEPALEGSVEGAGVGEALGGVGGQGGAHHAVQAVETCCCCGGGERVESVVAGAFGGVADHQGEERGTEGIDVGGRGGGGGGLGGQVAGRAGPAGGGRTDGHGEAPVHHPSLVPVADEDVRGLEVAVHDAFFVGVGNGSHGPERELQHRPQARSQALLLDAQRAGARQGDALHNLHRVVDLPVGEAVELVHRHDGGVVEARGDARFGHEVRGVLRAAQAVGSEHLHGDFAVQAGVERAQDPPEASFPQRPAGHQMGR